MMIDRLPLLTIRSSPSYRSTTDSGVAGATSADGVATGPDSSGTAHERFFFHVLLFLVSDTIIRRYEHV